MTPWLQRELHLSDQDFQLLLSRLNQCKACHHYQNHRCTLLARRDRQAHFQHLLKGDCEWATLAGNPYKLCRDCSNLKPGNKCRVFTAGCDAEARRLAILKTGHCRHYRPLERPTINYRGEHIPADTFITTDRLIADALRLASRINAANFDGVIAIARSGLIPATAIATHYHLNLWAVSPIKKTLAVIGSGHRLGDAGRTPTGRLLIIDDTACSSQTIDQIRRALTGIIDLRAAYTAAIYATTDAAKQLDIVGAIYERPHFLEWNFANCSFSAYTAFDMDGMICADPVTPDNDPSYLAHLENAPPLFLPRKWPTVIITARCSRYRQVTENWLQRHGIQLRELRMWEGDPDARWATPHTMALWKASVITSLRRDSGIRFYAESDPQQAQVIADQAKIPVICPQAEKIFRLPQQ